MNGAEQAVRCLVRGKVQGVFFRASTAREATRLGLRGWARNLPDGCVEVVVAGDPASVSKLSGWLWDGPSTAAVTAVTVEEWPGDVPSGFEAL